MLPLSKKRALERLIKGMPLIDTFAPQYPGAIVVPCNASNCYQPQNHGGVPNKPRGIVLHTPEERADNIEVTPYYFQNAGLDASTHYYLDNDGDWYQMVPESFGAIANGLNGKPLPSWALANTSLNWQTLSVEIEGYAHSIHETMPVGGVQFNSLAAWITHRAQAHGIPLDREHIVGHYQVADNRSDPGAKFPWAALMVALQEDAMTPQEKAALDAIYQAVLDQGRRLGKVEASVDALAKAIADHNRRLVELEK
jgi:N-acetyl-anhydromuramyl-L-alanine amidase AmpD